MPVRRHDDLVAELARERDPPDDRPRRADVHLPDPQEAKRLVRDVVVGELGEDRA